MNVNDIVLAGNNGGFTAANREALDNASQVFRNMVRNSARIEFDVPFPSDVMDTMVGYIQWNEVRIVRIDNNFQYLRFLVELLNAGSHFQLPQFKERVLQVFFRLIQNQGEGLMYSLAILEVCHNARPDVIPDVLWDTALERIRVNPNQIPTDVSFLSYSVIEKILKDDGMEWRECELFELLVVWAGDNRRHAQACALLKHIRLCRMSLPKLTTLHTFATFTATELNEVYEAQLRASSHGLHFDVNPRADPPRYQTWTERVPAEAPDSIYVSGSGAARADGEYKREAAYVYKKTTITHGGVSWKIIPGLLGVDNTIVSWCLRMVGPGGRIDTYHCPAGWFGVPPPIGWTLAVNQATQRNAPSLRLEYKRPLPANPFLLEEDEMGDEQGGEDQDSEEEESGDDGANTVDADGEGEDSGEDEGDEEENEDDSDEEEMSDDRDSDGEDEEEEDGEERAMAIEGLD